MHVGTAIYFSNVAQYNIALLANLVLRFPQTAVYAASPACAAKRAKGIIADSAILVLRFPLATVLLLLSPRKWRCQQVCLFLLSRFFGHRYEKSIFWQLREFELLVRRVREKAVSSTNFLNENEQVTTKYLRL